MAWCHLAKSHYLSQYLPGPTKAPLGVTSLWGIKSLLKILLASAAGLAFNYILIAANFIRWNSHDICMKCSIWDALLRQCIDTALFSKPSVIIYSSVKYSNINWLRQTWRYQMESFSASLDLCVGNSPMAGELSTQRPGTRSFVVVLWSAQE